MAIDAATAVSREIALASAVPQASLTRRDRELQVAEGRPPIKVAEAELEALRWSRREELREKWRKRKQARLDRSRALGLATDTRRQPQKGAEVEEAETGTLFDDRS
jgi:hypothetical protein